MRNCFVLISSLVLAACAGGSGGGNSAGVGNGGMTGNIPTDILTPEQRAAAIASNSQITDMNSFVVIGGTNPTINPNARAATTGIQQSDGGVRYDLSDVEFKTASMLMNTGVDDNAIIKFQIQDGKVNGINLSLEGVGTEDDLIRLHMDADRRDDFGIFAGTGSYQAGDEVVSLDADTTDFGLLYSSKAKDNDQELHYADWGVIQWGEIGEYDSSHYFAGGYDVKRTDTNANGNADYSHMNELAQNANENKLTFTGVADGIVRVGSMSDDEEINYTEGVNKLTLSTNATLEFAEGVSTLTANFDNWYDVSATMDNTGKLNTLNFTNGDKVDNDDNPIIANSFKWQREDEYLNEHEAEVTRNIILDPENPDHTDTVVRDGFVEYYGDDGNPAEAVGVIRYGDSLHESGAMRFDMGFGAKRD